MSTTTAPALTQTQALARLTAANALFLRAGNTAEQWLALDLDQLTQWLQLADRFPASA